MDLKKAIRGLQPLLPNNQVEPFQRAVTHERQVKCQTEANGNLQTDNEMRMKTELMTSTVRTNNLWTTAQK